MLVAGLFGVYVPSAVGYHKGSATLGRGNKATVALLTRNHALLVRKHFQGQDRLPIVVGHSLAFLLALRNRVVFSYLWGRISGRRAQRAIRHESTCPLMQEQVRSLIAAGERQILETQLKTGFDGFWRAYFWLLGRQ